MAAVIKGSAVKERPQDGSLKSKVDSSVNKKKIETSSKQPLDTKHKSGSSLTKSEVKTKTSAMGSSKITTTSSSKTTTTSSSKSTTTKTVKKRERKVFGLPGQRYDPPEEREPLRIFYESLSKQIPSSEMAEFWLMEHGLLSPERAKKAHERKQRRQKELRMGTPIKSPKLPSKPDTSQKLQQASKNGDVKAKKRIIYESDDDDDFILSSKKRKGPDELLVHSPCPSHQQVDTVMHANR
ncbi:uncharacterized protein LOC131151860 isoform X2 [Malania oleifera]|uniref:uncharacterized protein LOC131151860 isoform X2 n=1 Tax=Malania oleifera TaxID=397392 RepID=UPI0025AEAA4C|nr:uncharacterized protein LOC131151860 isoform X2 [Malania oleifera]XP_057959297.1 uncharacterized protein LOC131151860 isoform X2 [Malania oleifera]